MQGLSEQLPTPSVLPAPHAGVQMEPLSWRHQRTTEMMVPKTQDLIMEVMTSQSETARTQLSRMMFALTSYTISARNMLHAMPARTDEPEQPEGPFSRAAHGYFAGIPCFILAT